MAELHDAVPSTLRKINIRSTLEVLRKHGECSRAQLTRLLGVSAPTMSKLLDNLLTTGFIEEFSVDPVGKGRPSKNYKLAENSVFIVGLVIDIRDCRIVSAGLDGNFVPDGIITFPTPENYDDLLELIFNHLKSFSQKHNGKCLGIGISVPGLVDSSNTIELSPNIRMLDGRNLTTDLQKRLTCRITVLQEEFGMCLAERLYGSAEDCEDFALVDISSGMGMGVFSGNRYIHGASGFGGELGHITVKPDGPLCSCGNRGCLETLAGDLAIAGKLSSRLGRKIKSSEIVETVTRENLDISSEIDEAIYYLAIGVATVINLYNPRKVIIYGKMFDLSDHVMEKLCDAIKKRTLAPALRNCSIQRSQIIKIQGAIAGISSNLLESTGPQIDY